MKVKRRIKKFVQKRRDLFPDVDPEELSGDEEESDTEARLLAEEDEEEEPKKGKRRGAKKIFDRVNTLTAADKEFTAKDIRRFKKFEKYSEAFDDYTDGYAMMASWVWDGVDLQPDDVAGLCVADPTEVAEGSQANYASCWTLSRKGNKGRAVEYNSFTIDTSLLTADIDMVALLNTEGDVSDDLYPGFFGSW